jgi:hypothetical protein
MKLDLAFNPQRASLALVLSLAACGSSTPVSGTMTATDAGAVADVPAAADVRAAADVPVAADVPAAADARADGGTDPCAEQSPCPMDPRLTPMDIDACRMSLAGQRGQPCEAENAAVNECRARHIACGMDGMTDFNETSTRFNANCAARVTARDTCCMSPAGMGSPNCI